MQGAAPGTILLAAILAVALLKPLDLADQPLQSNELSRALARAGERVDIISDPAFAWFAWEMDPALGNRFLSGPTLRSAIQTAVVGTKVVWDSTAGAPYISEVDMQSLGYSEERKAGALILCVRTSLGH